MSDHDRGAYTPHNDAPLSFDARQSRGRRAFPTTLLISLVILVGLVIAIFMFYRSGVRGAGEAPVPVGSPVGEIKSPPPAQAQQATDPAQGLQIYKSEGAPEAASGTATFAPPPEQPQPRPSPAPTTPVAAQPIAPAAPAPAPAPVAAAPAPAPKPAAAAPTPAPAAKPAPAPVAAAAPAKPPAAADPVGALLESKAVKAAEAHPAKPEPKAAPAVTPGHAGTAVQIGAYSSAALASKGWSDLAKAYGSDMAGKGKIVEAVERDGKTLYRAAVSGFGSHADAVAFCTKLKGAGHACIVR